MHLCGCRKMNRRDAMQLGLAAFAVLLFLVLLQKIGGPQPEYDQGTPSFKPPTPTLSNITDETPLAAERPPVSSNPAPVPVQDPAPVPAPVPAPNEGKGLSPAQATPTRAHCMVRYGARAFIEPPTTENPPLLWTFPGSGNTWVRLLIEYATGYLTGSVYDDKKLKIALPGEYTCSRRNVMIKAHPHTHPFEVIDAAPFSKKCENVTSFDKAVFVVRDPYDACWSEYQRRVTQSHTGKLMRQKFQRDKWEKIGVGLAHDFQAMWNASYVPYMLKHPHGYLQMYYEDLRNPQLQHAALRKILEFMGRPQTEERIECAFVLANHPAVNRQQRSGTSAVSKDYAYTSELVCSMWEVFVEAALATGYSIRGDIDCANLPTSKT